MGCACSTSSATDRDTRNAPYDAEHLRGRVIPENDDFKLPRIEGPEDVRKTLLVVKDCDFFLRENSKEHNTEEYDLVNDKENPRVVIRRGQEFRFKLTFDREYKKDEDRIAIVFKTGKSPRETDGSKVVLPLYGKPRSKTWSIEVTEQEGNQVTFKVKSSPKCAIGRWNVRLNSLNRNDQEPALKEWMYPNPLYIIFNPWCKEDTVYSPDKDFPENYVKKEDGQIFVGNQNWIRGRDWTFAQFESPVIQCVIYILEEISPYLRAAALSDPVKVVRKLTSVVNSCDNYGLLVGNWSGKYEGGTKPTQWVGSQAILQEFWDTKQSVKYGQCWVFSGLLTTCCRAIGIPARSVTNFASAHDTDGSLTIDKHFSYDSLLDKLTPIEGMDSDSIWNFHVWNDVWMSRPDLPGEYEKAGWQACDATPQEASDGLMCCGPCPLNAIKNGMVNIPYDAPFIFAEVNGDEIHWMYNPSEDVFEKLMMKKKKVGKRISTYESGFFGNRQDVTDQYKYSDPISEDKSSNTAHTLIPTASDKREYYAEVYASEDDIPDVALELVDLDRVMYGDSYNVTLKATNTCKELRTVTVTLNSKSFYYTGVFFKDVKSEKFQAELKPEENKVFTMKVTRDEYEPCICENCLFKLYSSCKVKETGKVYFIVDDFDLDKPVMKVEVKSSEVKVGKTVKIGVSFVNSLPNSLTNGVLTIEGTGLQRSKKIKTRSIGGKENFEYEFEITPFKKGKRRLLLDFDSNEMIDVKGSCDVEVTE